MAGAHCRHPALALDRVRKRKEASKPLLSHLFANVAGAIAHYGYFAVVLGILLEDFGLPTPGETLLISGAIVASQGKLDIWILLPVAWAAAVVGDNIGYVIGRSGGHRLMLRYGGRVGITDDKLKQVEKFFARYGSVVVVFARFVVVLRQFNGIVAGTLGMPWWEFLALNALGAALWVGFWGELAFQLGKRFYLVSHHLAHLGPYLYALGGAAVVVGAGYLVWRAGRNRRRRAAPDKP
jgi:membrane protein DedA with SNARE-associated domain